MQEVINFVIDNWFVVLFVGLLFFATITSWMNFKSGKNKESTFIVYGFFGLYLPTIFMVGHNETNFGVWAIIHIFSWVPLAFIWRYFDRKYFVMKEDYKYYLRYRTLSEVIKNNLWFYISVVILFTIMEFVIYSTDGLKMVNIVANINTILIIAFISESTKEIFEFIVARKFGKIPE